MATSSDTLISGVNDTKPYPSTTEALITNAVYNLTLEATYLRGRALQARKRKDMERLCDAAEQIRRLSSRLERAVRS